MPVGVLVNSAAILIGGVIGALAGERIQPQINGALTGIFGLSAITMGLSLIIQMNYLSAVILALILGTLIGECCCLEPALSKGLAVLARKLPGGGLSDEQTDNLISMIILFCFSGTGIFGATTGCLVSAIAIPQLSVGVLLFCFGNMLLPLLTDFMIADFKAVGGVITMAVGLKISKIRHYQVLNMVPALVFVFFMSGLWDKLPF